LKKLLLLISTIFLLSTTVVCAESINIDYDIDFEKSELTIYCSNAAKYNQALSVVLYQGTEAITELADATAVNNYLQSIKKVADKEDVTDADESGNATIKMDLSDLQTGYYVISVAGGGRDKRTGTRVIKFVAKNDIGAIISEVNSANETNVLTVFTTYRDVFKLTNDVPAGVYTQFLKVRNNDFKNGFATVDAINNALEEAKILYSFNNANSETVLSNLITNNIDKIKNYIEENEKESNHTIEIDSKLPKIDTTSNDYKLAKDKIIKAIYTLKNNNQLTGSSSFLRMWGEAMAIGVINTAIINPTDLTTSIDIYQAMINYSYMLGISDYQAKCVLFGVDGDVLINTALVSIDFDSTQAIREKYNSRVAELTQNLQNQQQNSPGGTGGGAATHGSATSTDTGVVHINEVVSTPKFVDFSDLSEALWAQDSIKKLASEGIVSGYKDNSFKPNKLVSREEFVTLLIRAFKMYNSEAKCDFGDVEDSDWCYGYIASAVERQFVSGFEDGSFGKGNSISRQDAATMLYRAGKAYGLYLDNVEVTFNDSEAIAEYANEAIGALNNSGVINGFEDGCFKPLESLTRAQAVKMIELILSL